MAIIGAWLIYSGWLGIPGLTYFFSKHIFVILGRINFSTFMIHMLLIWHNDFKLHQPIEYRTFPLISRWITELVCAHVLGYLMYLVIEAPFYNLTKLFMQRAASKLSSRCSDKCTQTNGHRQSDKLKDQWKNIQFILLCFFYIRDEKSIWQNGLAFSNCSSWTTRMIHLLNSLFLSFTWQKC